MSKPAFVHLTQGALFDEFVRAVEMLALSGVNWDEEELP